ncbi:hypothetical protein J7K24_02800 [bacterium]|nr:hypothetical protein [bacterium]
MDKNALILDTLIGIIVCIIGIVLLMTLLRNESASVFADLQNSFNVFFGR